MTRKQCCSKTHCYPLLAVLNHNNNYLYFDQRLFCHNYPDHKLLLVALVRWTLSNLSRKLGWCSCSRDLTRSDCHSRDSYNKSSCRTRLIFLSFYFLSVDAGCTSIRLD